jgi:2-amino-4-hydroxy-6-hydroxymethyldihydropteridine diphosphokinase
MTTVYLGLGSNIGERDINLETAIALIGTAGVFVTGRSGTLNTEPVDFKKQPKFLNQVVRGETNLDPHALLKALQGIEKSMGRVKTKPKGPRIIDIDILLYDDLVMNEKDLVIPHPQITHRTFVMKHLIELDADLCDPETGKKYSEVMNGK